MVAIQLAGHVIITLLALAAIAVRIEHRLTKIETDVNWLKLNTVRECKGAKKLDGN